MEKKTATPDTLHDQQYLRGLLIQGHNHGTQFVLVQRLLERNFFILDVSVGSIYIFKKLTAAEPS